VLEAAAAACVHPGLRIVIEGLVDFDRGYFLRLGLFDRSFNPRRPAAALRHLSALLGDADQRYREASLHTEPGWRRIRLEGPRAALEILVALADRNDLAQEIERALAQGLECIDLLTGEPLDPGLPGTAFACAVRHPRSRA